MIIALIMFAVGSQFSGVVRWGLWGFGAWTLYGSLKTSAAVLDASAASADKAALLTGANYDLFNATGVNQPCTPRIY